MSSMSEAVGICGYDVRLRASGIGASLTVRQRGQRDSHTVVMSHHETRKLIRALQETLTFEEIR